MTKSHSMDTADGISRARTIQPRPHPTESNSTKRSDSEVRGTLSALRSDVDALMAQQGSILEVVNAKSKVLQERTENAITEISQAHLSARQASSEDTSVSVDDSRLYAELYNGQIIILMQQETIKDKFAQMEEGFNDVRTQLDKQKQQLLEVTQPSSPSSPPGTGRGDSSARRSKDTSFGISNLFQGFSSVFRASDDQERIAETGTTLGTSSSRQEEDEQQELSHDLKDQLLTQCRDALAAMKRDFAAHQDEMQSSIRELREGQSRGAEFAVLGGEDLERISTAEDRTRALDDQLQKLCAQLEQKRKQDDMSFMDQSARIQQEAELHKADVERLQEHFNQLGAQLHVVPSRQECKQMQNLIQSIADSLTGLRAEITDQHQRVSELREQLLKCVATEKGRQQKDEQAEIIYNELRRGLAEGMERGLTANFSIKELEAARRRMETQISALEESGSLIQKQNGAHKESLDAIIDNIAKNQNIGDSRLDSLQSGEEALKKQVIKLQSEVESMRVEALPHHEKAKALEARQMETDSSLVEVRRTVEGMVSSLQQHGRAKNAEFEASLGELRRGLAEALSLSQNNSSALEGEREQVRLRLGTVECTMGDLQKRIVETSTAIEGLPSGMQWKRREEQVEGIMRSLREDLHSRTQSQQASLSELTMDRERTQLQVKQLEDSMLRAQSDLLAHERQLAGAHMVLEAIPADKERQQQQHARLEMSLHNFREELGEFRSRQHLHQSMLADLSAPQKDAAHTKEINTEFEKLITLQEELSTRQRRTEDSIETLNKKLAANISDTTKKIKEIQPTQTDGLVFRMQQVEVALTEATVPILSRLQTLESSVSKVHQKSLSREDSRSALPTVSQELLESSHTIKLQQDQNEASLRRLSVALSESLAQSQTQQTTITEVKNDKDRLQAQVRTLSESIIAIQREFLERSDKSPRANKMKEEISVLRAGMEDIMKNQLSTYTSELQDHKNQIEKIQGEVRKLKRPGISSDFSPMGSSTEARPGIPMVSTSTFSQGGRPREALFSPLRETSPEARDTQEENWRLHTDPKMSPSHARKTDTRPDSLEYTRNPERMWHSSLSPGRGGQVSTPAPGNRSGGAVHHFEVLPPRLAWAGRIHQEER